MPLHLLLHFLTMSSYLNVKGDKRDGVLLTMLVHELIKVLAIKHHHLMHLHLGLGVLLREQVAFAT